MLLTPQNPYLIAPELARLLEQDPVATAQIREHIKPERLVEILGLKWSDITQGDMSISDAMDGLDFDDRDLLEYLVERLPHSKILAALSE